MGDIARPASGLTPEFGSSKELQFFRDLVDRWDLHPTSVPPAIEKVAAARALAVGNVSPQLVVFGLLHDLRQELTAAASSDPSGA